VAHRWGDSKSDAPVCVLVPAIFRIWCAILGLNRVGLVTYGPCVPNGRPFLGGPYDQGVY
jgi:hypothetical protein